MGTGRSRTWQNWAGNQGCSPVAVARPHSVDDLQLVVADARKRGQRIRVVGAGHSFTPLVCTDDVMVDIANLSGVIQVDSASAVATVAAGTRIRDLGRPLWEAGVSLSNQGDIDVQTIAGAAGTATHGSGRELTSFSGALRAVECVTSTGDLLTISDAEPDFDGYRTALGTLGIFTKIELGLSAAYKLHERIDYWPFAEVLERWEEETSNRRHFSYFWGPQPGSLELYGFSSAPAGLDQGCYVKLYDEVPPDVDFEVRKNERLAPAFEVYPSDFDTPFYELEYFVPFPMALPAVEAVRGAMARHPDQPFPLEVRTIKRDTAWLSPMFGVDSISISVSGAPGTDYWPFLRDVDEALKPFNGRPHWGKLHSFDRERFRAGYPRFDDFVALRRRVDPGGTFLNEHLDAIVG